MLDVTTTITINGSAGDRLLASLTSYRGPIPRALRWLACGPTRALAVDREDADHVAEFVDSLLESGWVSVDEPPLLYSPSVGDDVVLRCDVLAEIGHESAVSPAWRFMPARTQGTLIGWRDKPNDSRAIVDVYGTDRRLVIYVGETKVTRAQILVTPARRRLVG